MTILAALRRGIDRFVGGRGEFSITVPMMDGALKPNDRLERATLVATLDGADNAVLQGRRLLASSGGRIVEIAPDGNTGTYAAYDAPVTCLAASERGALAIGLDGVGVRISGGAHDGRLVDRTASGPLRCPTSAAFLDEDTLAVSNGSARFPASQWRHDLLHHGRSGSVSRIDLATGASRDLATGLGFPSGLCLRAGAGTALLVSEAWRHRVIELPLDTPSAPREALAALPAYPGRICTSPSGGYWLACFSVRSQLQEFVLREDRFRRQMIAEIDPAFWIAPALSSGKSFKEPLQAGGVIRLGIHKPWAPTRSYGLLVRLDEAFQPLWSAHSRADGARHGITSVVEAAGRLVATSKGKGEIVAIEHTGLAEPDDSGGAPGLAA